MKNRKLGLTLMALFTIAPTMVFALFESIPTSKSNLVASNNTASTNPNTLKSEPAKFSTDNTDATLSSTNVNSNNASGGVNNSTLTLPQQASQVQPATNPSTTLGSTLFGSKPYASTLSTLSKNKNSNDHDDFEDDDEFEDDEEFEDDDEFED